MQNSLRQTIIAIIAAFVALVPLAAFAEADGPDAWRVIGVSPDDHLNARMGPGIEYPVLAALPHDARALQMQACVPTFPVGDAPVLSDEMRRLLDAPVWCLVSWTPTQNSPEFGRGWVNRRFLGEDG